MLEMEAASIAMVQDTVDAMNPKQKRVLLKQLHQMQRHVPSMPVWAYIVMTALGRRCSVARAVEIMLQMAADGELKTSARIGSPNAPLTDIPASMFRHEV